MLTPDGGSFIYTLNSVILDNYAERQCSVGSLHKAAVKDHCCMIIQPQTL